MIHMTGRAKQKRLTSDSHLDLLRRPQSPRRNPRRKPPRLSLPPNQLVLHKQHQL